MAKKKPPKPTYSEQQLVMMALDKIRRGETPTRDEKQALDRYEKHRDEETRQKHFTSITIGEWVQWSGRQHKVLQDQAARYGIPLAATFDLKEIARWLHDFLAANARLLNRESDPTLTDPLDRYRDVKAQREEIKLQVDRGKYVDRSQVLVGQAEFAGYIREAGEKLRKNFGPDAYAILKRALNDAIAALEKRLGDPATYDNADIAIDDAGATRLDSNGEELPRPGNPDDGAICRGGDSTAERTA